MLGVDPKPESGTLNPNWLRTSQARGGRSLCGLGGGAALALQVLTPALFFLVMCLPKYYLPVTPTRLPAQLFPPADLDLPTWARSYTGARCEGLQGLPKPLRPFSATHQHAVVAPCCEGHMTLQRQPCKACWTASTDWLCMGAWGLLHQAACECAGQ